MQKHRKTIVILSALAAAVLAVFSHGCTSAENTQVKTPIPKETESTFQETAVPSDPIETISVTEPVLTVDNQAFEKLKAQGFDESDLRKKHTFDSKNLNSQSNKDYVLDRMCNSIDYFTTLQSSYLKTVNNRTTWVTYIIDRRIKKAKELVYNVSDYDNTCTPLKYYCTDGNYHIKTLFKDNEKDKYTFSFTTPFESSKNTAKEKVKELIKKPMANELTNVTDKPMENIFISDRDIDETMYLDITKRIRISEDFSAYFLQRSDAVELNTAHEHYLPQYFVLSTFYNYKSWTIDSKDSNNKGREIIHISGTYKENGMKKSIKLDIDKETGIIVSMKIYNNSNTLIEEWKTIELIIDGEVDKSVFDKIEV